MDATQIAVVSLVVAIAAAVVSLVSAVGTLIGANAARRDAEVAERTRLDVLDSTSTIEWAWRWSQSWPPAIVVTNLSHRHRAYDITVGFLHHRMNSADLRYRIRAEVGPQSTATFCLPERNEDVRALVERQRQQILDARTQACADPGRTILARDYEAALRSAWEPLRLFVRWRNSPRGELQEWFADPPPKAFWDVASIPPPEEGEWPMRRFRSD